MQAAGKCFSLAHYEIYCTTIDLYVQHPDDYRYTWILLAALRAIAEEQQAHPAQVPIHKLPSETLGAIFKVIKESSREARHDEPHLWIPGVCNVCRS